MIIKILLGAIGVLISLIFFYWTSANTRIKILQSNDPFLRFNPFIMGTLVFISLFLAEKYTTEKIDILKIFIVLLGCGIAAIWDRAKKIIPNKLIIVMIVIRVVIFIFEFIFRNTVIFQIIINSLLGLGISFLLLSIFSILSKGGLGMGDVKLISTIGFYCGTYLVFNSVFISLVLCTIISVISILVKKRKIKDKVAFGPYIFIGVVVSVMIGAF